MPEALMAFLVSFAIGMAACRLIPAVFMTAVVVLVTFAVVLAAVVFGWSLNATLRWWGLTGGAFQIGIVAGLVLMAIRHAYAAPSPELTHEDKSAAAARQKPPQGDGKIVGTRRN